ncbi:molybdate ABC transporter substrate-binding protein [Desulfocurvibacter africanus]|uniref:molybdate ABC transporter substrate-binding protein n=1 Tax=Desulfocurvibacter africanus TaxID=873 RepID=UPI000424E4F7|nr:molybdate ABC transporter substrate-binding protein [Desulfocurvibacter africanus]
MKRLILSCFLALTMVIPARAAELTVSAAASLTDAFNEIKPLFEAAHHGNTLVMNFAASGPLYKQIEQGAPVDVFASANQKWMNEAEKKGFVAAGTRKDFAANALVLAVPADNPAKIRSTADLEKKGVQRIALGTPETVPAGQYAKQALVKAGKWDALAPKFIYGESVRQVLDYLARDEVDAGFVYATDAAKEREKVYVLSEIELEQPVTYPIAVMADSTHKDLALSFLDFLGSDEGRAILSKWGFKKP